MVVLVGLLSVTPVKSEVVVGVLRVTPDKIEVVVGIDVVSVEVVPWPPVTV